MWLPGQRMAGIVAALYFALHPSLYYMVFHFAALDNIYILVTIACVACYGIGLKSRAWRGWVWSLIAAGLYALALTSKEATFILPVYVLGMLILPIFKRGGVKWR